MSPLSPARAPLVFAAAYTLAGILWFALARGGEAGAWGWAFVLLSAPVLYGTLRAALGTAARPARADSAGQSSTEILETLSDGWFSLDGSLTVRSCNRAAEEILARPRTEVLGRQLGAAFPELADAAFLQKVSQAVRDRAPVAFETHVTTKPFDNWYDARAFPTQDGLSLFLRVTTDRRRLEAQLSQGQKMEAVGRLAGGVAHDFNNQLAAILGYSELVLKDLAPDHPARARAEQIRRAAERAATLTRQLLAFGRRQVLEPEMLNLSSVVSDLEEMLRRTIGEDVELTTRLAHDLESVKADRAQVEHALLHLVVNARDAMPQGGRLAIETRAVTLDADYCRRHLDARPGKYVLLAVADTGGGMDRKTIERLFEPFFTTKAFGTGTGMGLSMVYGFVTQSGGHIAVESEMGHGSRFMMYLPCGGLSVAVSDRPTTPPAPSPRGNETILVVEDEPVVRRLIVDVLRASGYRVLEAPNGDEGRKAADGHEGPIHLLLTDVIMPLMSGQALAATLNRSRPGMRVLFMSGHTEEAMGPQGLLDSTRLLEKPFTPTALVRRVRDALGASASSGASGC